MKDTLRFRQVHLDFHTSPEISGIGVDFDKKQWQNALKAGHVDSINVFSKCHHGWSYHPTKVGKTHPGLKFDLLKAQLDACHEIDVNTPVYISAGLDNVAAHEHPEWRRIGVNGQYAGWAGGLDQPGFLLMCFNTPYLDYLCAQIREVVERYPRTGGIWLDIISEGECCCKWCMEWMEQHGLDARKPEDRRKAAEYTVRKYYEATTKACRSRNPKMPLFHNSSHITPGHRDILKFFSQLELESLPTGGWGYDHFPASAKYVNSLELDYLGMTGKFHRSWGEFGGFKHPNALKYECAAMLAYGSKCCVGDQLHPNGKMDESTYEIVGEAYEDVKRKEPWCGNVTNVADIGLLLSSTTKTSAPSGSPAQYRDDTGATRVLLEAHFLFDILDMECDFTKYRMLVLPDAMVIPETLKKRLDAYLKQGGKLFLCGKAGLDAEGKKFLFDVGAECEGVSEYATDYILPVKDLQASFVKTPLVMYYPSQRIRAKKGAQSLGDVYDPYFNRTYQHFCSHRHTPNKPKPSGYDCGVRKGNIVYLAHPVFTVYHDYGAVAYREYIANAMRMLLEGDTLSVQGLPSGGRATLMRQAKEKRLVAHLLYANKMVRGAFGGIGTQNDGTTTVEIIEELDPLFNIKVAVTPGKKIKSVTFVPEGKAVGFTQDKAGVVRFTVPEVTCHQMVELAY